MSLHTVAPSARSAEHRLPLRVDRRLRPIDADLRGQRRQPRRRTAHLRDKRIHASITRRERHQRIKLEHEQDYCAWLTDDM
jgi:hypothetical protein